MIFINIYNNAIFCMISVVTYEAWRNGTRNIVIIINFKPVLL